MEVCITILAVLILGPIALRLLGAILRGLGPLLKVAVAVIILLGIASLAFQVVSSVISGAVDLIFGPLGLLLLGGAAVYLGFREWNKRHPAPLAEGDVIEAEKPKRGAGRLVDIGDDGEIVTLDELLDEDGEKKKRG